MFEGFIAVPGNGARDFLCTRCAAFLTRSDQFLSLKGKFRHFFVNPAGVACDFYTFEACEGIVIAGTPTEEHTWFPGFRWTIALCEQCTLHLGWHYTPVGASSPRTEFFGLLISQLTTREAPSDT